MTATVEDTVKQLKESKENIVVYVHNTCIEIKRRRRKASQGHRFYGGQEQEEDLKYCRFHTSIIDELTKGNRFLRRTYYYPIM